MSKNTNNKTPREEVELVTSLKGSQSSGSGESDLDPDYYKTLAFLLEQEEKIEQSKDSSLDKSQTGKENISQSSNISSDESEPIDSEEEEAENGIKKKEETERKGTDSAEGKADKDR